MPRRSVGAWLVAAAAFGVVGCTPLGLNTASINFEREEPASPAVLDAFGADPPVRTAQEWETRRAPMLRQAFETYVYGPVPMELDGVEVSRRIVDPAYANGAGVLEEIDVRVGEGDAAFTYKLALAAPKDASAQKPAPLILNTNFGGTAGTMGSSLLSGGGMMNDNSMMARIIRLIFGQHIIEGPNETILRRGYAYATLFPGEFAADSAQQAQIDLADIARLLPPGRAPKGVVAVWAASFGWSLDVLEADPRIDAGRTAVWGHSRHGKAALLAAAFDTRIEATIPLQSGKGGATLTRAYAGESVKQITRSYPHWFTPAYADYSGRERDIPIDQHQLLALVAPRPVMLGNGWKDVWSDPNGSFRAAIGADPAYRLFNRPGLVQASMRERGGDGGIDWFIRPGGHGVRASDWAYMLDWLDRVMPAAPPRNDLIQASSPTNAPTLGDGRASCSLAAGSASPAAKCE